MKIKNLAIAALLLAVLGPAAAAQDLDGSADHPLIGRFAGSMINAYDFREFDEYDFAGQPITTDDGEGFQSVEGVTTRIAYTLAGDHSLAEVARNYEIALADKRSIARAVVDAIADLRNDNADHG